VLSRSSDCFRSSAVAVIVDRGVRGAVPRLQQWPDHFQSQSHDYNEADDNMSVARVVWRRRIDIRRNTERRNQAQTFGMIVENQNPSDGFAANINFWRWNDGEDSRSC